MAAKPPLERAARALCTLAGNPENATMNGKPLWMDYLPEARAVIEAIREPSNRMIALGDEVMQGRYGCSFEVRPIYTEMIDSLLAE